MRKSGSRRSLRTVLLVLAGILLLASGVMFARAMMVPVRVSARKPMFDYDQRASIDYKVNLLPNTLYDQLSLGPGSAYFTNLVKNIEVRFAYSLDTTPSVDVECTYSVSGTLRVYDTVAKDAVVLWSKRYDLVPQAKASSAGGKLRLDKALVLDLAQYNPIVDKIYQLTEVKPARAAITLEWVVQPKTPEGIPVSEPVTATLVVPVAAKYFTIGGEPTASGKGSFTVSDQTVNTKAIALRRNWGIALGVCLALFVVGLLVPAGDAEKQAKVLRALLTKFGSRLAKSRTTELSGSEVVDLATADDLLRVADELGKPVIYVPGDAVGRPHVFYVLDGNTRYQYSPYV